MRTTRRTWLALLAFSAAFAAQPAPAQELQAGKAIRLIVALSPGGGTDVTARLVAQKMTASMGMNVIVENKTGGNFIPAGREVLTAAPDGHTLYFISTSSVITQTMHSDYPFDITKFSPVTEAATGPLILVVRNNLGVKTIGELLDMAKKNPGKLKFGTGGGTASSLYLATELFKSTTGADISPATPATRRGHARRSRCEVVRRRTARPRPGRRRTAGSARRWASRRTGRPGRRGSPRRPP